MTFNDYFHSTFRNNHLPLMNFRATKDNEKEIYFGGYDWETVKKDLDKIPLEQRPDFLLSLFMIIITDQAIFTCFKDSYETWRKQTMFPHFAWPCGIGYHVHHNNPYMILSVPERENMVDITSIKSKLPEFMDFFIIESDTYFAKHLPAISTKKFFAAITKDISFEFNEGTVVPAIKEELFSKVIRMETNEDITQL